MWLAAARTAHLRQQGQPPDAGTRHRYSVWYAGPRHQEADRRDRLRRLKCLPSQYVLRYLGLLRNNN